MRGFDRTLHDSSPPLRSERLVEFARWAVVGLTLAIAAVELGRVAALGELRNTLVAAVATAIYVPLHLWHLRYGMRGERPPRSLATLAIVVAVEFAAVAIIGPAWTFTLAIVATSSLIVLRPPWSWLIFAACVLAPLPADVVHPHYATVLGASPFYFVWSVAYRSCLQFILVWLVAGAHELVVTREALARQAATREQERLETAMRVSLERSLKRLAHAARRARASLAEPGIAAALLGLDAVLSLSHRAAEELRRAVLQARAGRSGSALDQSRLGVADRARPPIGRGLSLPRARRSFVATNTLVLGVVPLGALGALGGAHPGPALIPAWLALTVVQLASLRDVARGLRPRWAPARAAFALAVTIAMMAIFSTGWREPGWYVGVAIAVAFTGRARIVLIAALFAVAGAYELWRATSVYSAAGELVWWYGYAVTQIALGVFASYGSARLIMLTGELQRAREEYVREAVQSERRRAWADLHDVLGQTLLAISLKADLARRLLPRRSQRARAELDELIGLAEHADELATISRGERVIAFDAELRSAVALLVDAGIEVSTEVELDDLDRGADAMLGLAVREATTNILRHAHASRAWIRVVAGPDRLVLEIGNDGAGSRPGTGTGLRSLTERAAAVDGEVQASFRPGGVFALEVSLPLWARV